MTTRIKPLRIPPIAFAHRGARALAPDNTIESFALAVDMGATAIESDVWITADDVAVLDHDGSIRRRVGKTSIRKVEAKDLPEHIPTLGDVFASLGVSLDVSLDLKDPEALDAVVRTVRDFDSSGSGLARRMWLCTPSAHDAAEGKQRYNEFRFVHSTRLSRIGGPERHAAALAEANIDAINMHHSDWSGGLVTLFHRFGLLCFAWDCQFDRVLDQMFDSGIDAVYSDHVDRMLMSRATFFGPEARGDGAGSV